MTDLAAALASLAIGALLYWRTGNAACSAAVAYLLFDPNRALLEWCRR